MKKLFVLSLILISLSLGCIHSIIKDMTVEGVVMYFKHFDKSSPTNPKLEGSHRTVITFDNYFIMTFYNPLYFEFEKGKCYKITYNVDAAVQQGVFYTMKAVEEII